MVVDTSAIVAALAGEGDADAFKRAMLDARDLTISAMTALETKIVLQARFGPAAVAAFDRLLRDSGVTIAPFDAAMSEAAFEAFKKFGKGQGSPAQLNFGDCAAYALAMARDEALLFKGKDFALTDVTAALPAQDAPKG